MTAAAWPAPGAIVASGAGRWRRYLDRRQAAEDEHTDRLIAYGMEFDIRRRWREVARASGLTQRNPTGGDIRVPEIVRVEPGPPMALTIDLLAGQTATDLLEVATRLAGHLGAHSVRVRPAGLDSARVLLVPSDPLAGLVTLDPADVSGGTRVMLGRTEDGEDLIEHWRRQAHTVVQGVTRSGKSVMIYGLLATLAGDPLVKVHISDPTGLLSRVFTGTRHADGMVEGLKNPGAHLALVERLVSEMDDRIAELPDDRDTIAIDAGRPLLVLVLEEYAGLLRSIDAVDKPAGIRVRAGLARLLAEGAKVGIRVIILVQRAEANIIGAFERAMCSLRISFRVDNAASVELLHPGTPKEVIGPHASAAPGVALVSMPGRELLRMRAPVLGGDADDVYPAFRRAVRLAG